MYNNMQMCRKSEEKADFLSLVSCKYKILHKR